MVFSNFKEVISVVDRLITSGQGLYVKDWLTTNISKINPKKATNRDTSHVDDNLGYCSTPLMDMDEFYEIHNAYLKSLNNYKYAVEIREELRKKEIANLKAKND